MDTRTSVINDTASLLHILRLASPTLPVGAYAYSQGMEHATDQGWLTDEAGARDWMLGLMTHAMSRVDVPLFGRLYRACEQQQAEQYRYWNQYLLASRESRELQDEDLHLGNALLQLLSDLGNHQATDLIDQTYTYAAAFSLACVHWQIDLEPAVSAYVWAWLDNQVAAAVKLVPLGQTAGQRILLHCSGFIPEVVATGLALEDDAIGFSSAAQAIGSAHHEQQYSRLFRS